MGKNQRGTALITAIMVVVLVSGLLAACLTLATNEGVFARYHYNSVHATYLAEAGAEKALGDFQKNPSWYKSFITNQSAWDEGQQIKIYSNQSLDRGIYDVFLQKGSNDNEVIIISSGQVHKASKTVRVTVLVSSASSDLGKYSKYVIFSGQEFYSGTNLELIAGTGPADVHSNANISIWNNYEIDGKVTASGTISLGPKNQNYIKGGIQENAAPISWPPQDLKDKIENYKNEAKGSPKTFDNGQVAYYPGDVSLVNQDTLSDWLRGKGLGSDVTTVIIDGNFSADKLKVDRDYIIVTNGNFQTKNEIGDPNNKKDPAEVTIVSFGEIDIQNNANIKGMILGRKCTIKNNMTMVHDITGLQKLMDVLTGSSDGGGSGSGGTSSASVIVKGWKYD